MLHQSCFQTITGGKFGIPQDTAIADRCFDPVLIGPQFSAISRATGLGVSPLSHGTANRDRSVLPLSPGFPLPMRAGPIRGGLVSRSIRHPVADESRRTREAESHHGGGRIVSSYDFLVGHLRFCRECAFEPGCRCEKALRMRPVTIGRQIPHVRSGHGSSIDRWCQCCLVPGRVRRLGAQLPFTSPEGIASKEQPREHRNCYRVTHSTECNENVRLVQSVHSKIVVKFL